MNKKILSIGLLFLFLVLGTCSPKPMFQLGERPNEVYLPKKIKIKEHTDNYTWYVFKHISRKKNKAVLTWHETKEETQEVYSLLPVYDGDDYTKLRKINRHIIDTYDYDYGYTNRTAYSGYRTGKMVCIGFAEMVKLLCDKNGIPCYIVNSSNHAWNVVIIKNKWYNIDTTWNNTSRNKGGTGEEYFLKGDSFFSTLRNHTVTDGWGIKVEKENYLEGSKSTKDK